MTTRNSIAGAALVAAVTLFTVTAAPAQVQTGPGYALSVTNAGQYVTAAIPALASNYTISAWVFLNGGGDLFSHRVGVLSATNCCGSVEVLVRSDSVLSTDPQYLELGRCGCFNGAGSAGVVPINQWVHLAVSVSSNQQISYYINGAADISWDGSALDLSLGTNITLADNTIRMFNGTLDEVQIWSTALSQEEIQDGMNEAPDVTDTNLVAYWAFNEGAGSTATNSATATGSACDGTLVNSPAYVLSGVPFVPDTMSGGATIVSLTNATLTGTVNPGNLSGTAWFEWGTDTKYGNFTTAESLSATNDILAVSAGLTNLTPGVTYHYTLEATNEAGLTLGNDLCFTTEDVPRTITGCSVKAAGGCQFQFTGATGSSYTVLGTTNMALPPGNWLPLGTATEISPGLYQFTDGAAANQAARFYRLRWP